MATSIIIPVYNQEKYIGRAIRSAIANKKHSDIEIVVVNDSSTDHTSEILEDFSKYIVLLKNDENMGLPYSLNKGIKKASSKYVFRLDSDDYIQNKTISTLETILDMNNNIDAIAVDYILVDDRQNTMIHINSEKEPIGCGIIFRKEHLIEIGLYDEEMRWHEDKELIMRFKKQFKIFHLPVPFYRYHIHGNNMTLDKDNYDKYLSILKERNLN